MRAKLLGYVSAICLALGAVVVTAPAAEAKSFPGWTTTRLSLSSVNSILSSNGLSNFYTMKNRSGPCGTGPCAPGVGNNFSNFQNQKTSNLVFRVRKGFNGALPNMQLVLWNGSGQKQRFTFHQINNNGIISLYFTYNGKKIYFSPT
jgi:hypothetical protein